MTDLPSVTIERSGDGWLVTCSCGFERQCGRRPSADRVASDHRAQPHKAKRSTSSAPKPKTRASWDDREDSTWIDKL